MLALLALTCATTAISQPTDSNLLANPGMETADDGLPAFWEARTPTDVDRLMEWVATSPHSGERCLKITNHSETKSRWRAGHDRDIRLKPGSEATLTGWVRHEGGGAGYLRFYFLGVKGGVIAQPSSAQITGDSKWTQVTVSATVPAESAYVMAYCENDGAGTTWFDDLVMTGETHDGDPKPEPPPAIRFGVDEFDASSGLGKRSTYRTRVADIRPGEPGHFEVWWGSTTGRYDVEIEYSEKPEGAVSARLRVDGREAPITAKVATTIDIQHHSRVAFDITVADGGECRLTGVAFTRVGRFSPAGLRDDLKLPTTLNCFPTEFERRPLRSQLGSYIAREFVAPATQARADALDALATPEDWRARQAETRAMLPEILGDFGPKCPLNARVVSRIERDAYTIEQVIIESQPGYHVPCNFYIPKGRPLPAPGVIFTCGHSGEGKGYHLYHECCLGLVLKGYCVLAVDPMGQGERSEYFDDEGKPTVPLTVSQHHQLLRPSWLMGRSLAGHRTWDLHRAVDYLVTREEVDAEKLAVTGNSGGGQMSLLIMAFDERLKVCAAAHPGGSCENVYLTGSSLYDRRILSLIAPRACRFIVGEDSGEGYHETKHDDMMRFYQGLGDLGNRLSFEWVDGVHNMEQPKREAAYEWLNQWFGREAEGKAEPALEPEEVEALWASGTGLTMTGLGSESGQTLLTKLADSASRAGNVDALRRRIGMRGPAPGRPAPHARVVQTMERGGVTIQKLLLNTDAGIELPAVFFKPKNARGAVSHVSDKGKPRSFAENSIVFDLVKQGKAVLSVDVRGVGEADLSPSPWSDPSRGYEPTQWRRDMQGINCAYGDTTLLAMRASDVVRCVDWLAMERGFSEISIIGEGLGGLWCMVAATFDARVSGVECRGTLYSYRSILETPIYHVQGYFWVPGALLDYDIADLPSLIAPCPVTWIDPIDASGNIAPLDAVQATNTTAKIEYSTR